MKHSTFRPLEAMTRPLAIGHHPLSKETAVLRPAPENAANWAPGSLFTNLDDLGHFVRLFLNRGKEGDAQIIPARAIERMSSPHAHVEALDRDYGYGLDLRHERGIDIIGHTGSRLGYGSVIWMVPERQAAVVILTNRTGAVFTRSAWTALELMLPLEKEAPRPVSAPMPMTDEELTLLAGTYVNSAEVRARLVVENGSLKIWSSKGGIEVVKIGPSHFHAAGGGPLSFFEIVPGADGSPRYLVAEMWAARRIEDASPARKGEMSETRGGSDG